MSIIPKGDNLDVVNDAIRMPESGLTRNGPYMEYTVKSWHPSVEIGKAVEIHCVLIPKPVMQK